jgi:hypothetical protein
VPPNIHIHYKGVPIAVTNIHPIHFIVHSIIPTFIITRIKVLITQLSNLLGCCIVVVAKEVILFGEILAFVVRHCQSALSILRRCFVRV